MTLIVGLALNYAPDILNFVLVDYKGGGTFQPFRNLPHCVDVITNLNKAGVNRMFTAINAEMRRRQRLNADTGTKDIIEYRAKGLHLNGGQPSIHVHSSKTRKTKKPVPITMNRSYAVQHAISNHVLPNTSRFPWSPACLYGGRGRIGV